jgi:hypothetical protein
MMPKKRFLLLPLAGALLFLPLASGQANAETFLNRMFPSIFGAPAPKVPGPEETLQAPFSTDGNAAGTGAAATEASPLMKMYDDTSKKNSNTMDLAVAHRSEEQLAEWLTGVTTLALNISPQTWNEDIKKFAAGFSPYGLQEYKAYLDKTAMLTTLQTNNLRLQAITDGKPVLLKEASIDGVYHWLFNVPLLLTYYDQDTHKIEKGQKVRQQTQRVTAQIQVGRIASKPDEIGVVVERWIIQSN